MTIPLLDLKREHQTIAAEVRAAWDATLDAMHLLKGDHVAHFEQEIAAYTGTADAIGVASGTDALLLTLLGLRIGKGDEVILHTNAFVAALEAIHHSGAQPVLVDCEPDGPGPDVEAVAAAITVRTKALIVVHLYGSPLNLDRVRTLCSARGVALIEDGSHAHGASQGGCKVGSLGQAGCFSAGVVKNLGAYGDAGYVTTDDMDLARQVRLLQTHGQEKKHHHVTLGFNSRLDELQAAVLRIKLRYLDARNLRRAAIANCYREQLANVDLRLPREQPGEVHVYHQFVVRTAQRDRLRAHLKARGVRTGIHYPVPLHRQPAWLQRHGESPPLPRAERLASEILSLPVFPDLTDAEVRYVADSVIAFFRGA